MTTTVAARQGLPVTITAGGGAARGFVPNVEQITWLTVPPTRQGSDQGAGPGEQSLSNEVVWRRSRESWHLGAGQEYADTLGDTDEDIQRLRFYTSYGVDPWTKRGLTVLRASRQILAGNVTNCISTIGITDSIVVTIGADVRYTENPIGPTPTWTTHTGLGANNKQSITTDGRQWWCCDGSDIYKGRTGVIAATVLSTYDANLVGYANGRLLAANNVLGELVEVHADGSTTTLFTHPSAGFLWKGIVPSPAGIYVFGQVGDTSEVFVITAIDTTGGLDVPFVVAPWPQGEFVRCMCSYAGVMVIGTSRGIRLAMITGGGFLSYGPLVDEPGDVLCLEPQLEDVWFGWSNDVAPNGLGRLRLSRFVEELVPAFASDVMMHTGSVGGDVVSACTWGSLDYGGRRFFAISGVGLYGEQHTAIETSATIDLGWFSYGIPEAKMLDSVAIWTDALPAGASVVVNVYADGSLTPLLTGTFNTAGQKTENFAYAGTATGERFRITLTITTNGVDNLVIRRVTLRGAPRPFMSERVVLPLMLGSAVTDPSTESQLGLDPYEEWTTLRDIMLNRERCTVRVGALSFDARIEALEVEKGGLGGGNGLDGFDDRGRWFEGTWDVAFTTLEPSG